MSAPPPDYDAVLLTGGRSRRLAGADKAGLVVGGRSMGQRAAGAVADSSRLVVVGPCPTGLDRQVIVTREDPPGTGPVAAIADGMRHVRAPYVAVLAADQPFVTAEALADLRGALADADTAVAVALPVDGGGHDQPLCAVWRTDALHAALDSLGDPTGVSVRRLLESAGLVVRVTGMAADGRPPPWFDCDTPADLAEAQAWA